jgi:hypothetical protein
MKKPKVYYQWDGQEQRVYLYLRSPPVFEECSQVRLGKGYVRDQLDPLWHTSQPQPDPNLWISIACDQAAGNAQEKHEKV